MIDGDFRLTEPNAIMKYIATKYGEELLGTDPAQIAKVEMVAQQISDLKGPVVTMPCYTSGDRAAITANLLEKVKPLVRFLGTKRFLIGDNVTYVDFIFFELCDFMNWIAQGKLFEGYPVLLEYFNNVKALPRLAEFYADDERCMKRPYNNKIAKLNN